MQQSWALRVSRLCLQQRKSQFYDPCQQHVTPATFHQASLHDSEKVIVLFSFCGCQRPEQQQQQHKSTIWRLGRGGCAYSEVSGAERDELSSAIAWGIHQWIWGHRAGRNQQMEGHYLDHLAPLISSCSWTSGDTGQTETMFVSGKSVPFTSGNYSRDRTSK